MHSPIPGKRNINISNYSGKSNISNDENIFLEMKPVKFDGLYKKEMSKEELIEEIKKLTMSTKITNNQNEANTTSRRAQKTAQSEINDNAYPFKQEKFNCIIF